MFSFGDKTVLVKFQIIIVIFKASFLSKDKEKPPTPIPGAAVPTTNTASATVNVASSKKLLNRSRRNTEVADTANVGGDKGQTGKSSESEGKTSPPGTPVGQFHHLPHYYRLYEIVKGAFGNYKVRLNISSFAVLSVMPEWYFGCGNMDLSVKLKIQKYTYCRFADTSSISTCAQSSLATFYCMLKKVKSML